MKCLIKDKALLCAVGALILFAIILYILLPYSAFAADTYPYRLYLSSDAHDSVSFIVQVENGATTTWAEVFGDTIKTFPYDTTLVLQSDSSYQIVANWFANGNVTPKSNWEYLPRRNDTLITATSTLASNNITLAAALDSMRIAVGYKANGFTYQYQSADVDTLVIGIGTDTLWDVIYYHEEGSAGDAPDSTRVQIHP